MGTGPSGKSSRNQALLSRSSSWNLLYASPRVSISNWIGVSPFGAHSSHGVADTEGACHLAPAVGGPSLPRRAAAPLVHHVARAPSPDEALSLTVAPYAGCISGIDGRPCQNTCKLFQVPVNTVQERIFHLMYPLDTLARHAVRR